MIVTYTDAAALAAKMATTTNPIVFVNGGDPVRAGIVHSLNRPGDNITGVSFTASISRRSSFAVTRARSKGCRRRILIDQNVPDAVAQVPVVQEAARNLGLQLIVLKAHIAGDIDTAFETLVRERAGALLVGTGALLTNRRKQIIALAERHAMPAIYPYREFTVAAACSATATTCRNHFAKPASCRGYFQGRQASRSSGCHGYQFRVRAQP